MKEKILTKNGCIVALVALKRAMCITRGLAFSSRRCRSRFFKHRHKRIRSMRETSVNKLKSIPMAIWASMEPISMLVSFGVGGQTFCPDSLLSTECVSFSACTSRALLPPYDHQRMAAQHRAVWEKKRSQLKMDWLSSRKLTVTKKAIKMLSVLDPDFENWLQEHFLWKSFVLLLGLANERKIGESLPQSYKNISVKSSEYSEIKKRPLAPMPLSSFFLCIYIFCLRWKLVFSEWYLIFLEYEKFVMI